MHKGNLLFLSVFGISMLYMFYVFCISTQIWITAKGGTPLDQKKEGYRRQTFILTKTNKWFCVFYCYTYNPHNFFAFRRKT